VAANNSPGRAVTIVSFSIDEQYRDKLRPFHGEFQSGSLRRCARPGLFCRTMFDTAVYCFI